MPSLGQLGQPERARTATSLSSKRRRRWGEPRVQVCMRTAANAAHEASGWHLRVQEPGGDCAGDERRPHALFPHQVGRFDDVCIRARRQGRSKQRSVRRGRGCGGRQTRLCKKYTLARACVAAPARACQPDRCRALIAHYADVPSARSVWAGRGQRAASERRTVRCCVAPCPAAGDAKQPVQFVRAHRLGDFVGDLVKCSRKRAGDGSGLGAGHCRQTGRRRADG